MDFDQNNIPHDEKFYVRYKCRSCGRDRVIQVPPKHRAVDMQFRMKKVIQRIYDDHMAVVPVCAAPRSGQGHVDLMIPVNAEGVMGKFLKAA